MGMEKQLVGFGPQPAIGRQQAEFGKQPIGFEPLPVGF
jgi:hypothetical protein